MKKVTVTVRENKVYQYDLAMPDEDYNALRNGDEWEDFDEFLDACVEAIDDPHVGAERVDYNIGVDSIFDENDLLYLCY